MGTQIQGKIDINQRWMAFAAAISISFFGLFYSKVRYFQNIVLMVND